MRVYSYLLAASVAVLSINQVQAQDATAKGANIIGSTADNASSSVLRAGTSVLLRTREELTTEKKKLRVGQRIQMEVADSVLLNGQVVIPAGSPATGEITQVRNKGMWGKSGYIGARALYVRVDGRQIRLTGQFDDKGVTGTAAVVGAAVFAPIAGFFTTGTSARIPIDTPVKAFVDEDVVVPASASRASAALASEPPAPPSAPQSTSATPK